ncbi:conserved hypothetical protein [Sporisorium reilianum SRZ2]|uniref:Uncharacterized protein n=1 Tax=Sporisorium reilianum (strain SRZ2) TaxID=999809 RepID=E6ZU72_SPORE|nr:conserved hypothetical protein [Sporisorium reilianum SRZ2]
MSFAPLPAPGTPASSSIWARRMVTKSTPTTDAEVELNVLSLLLDVPRAVLDSSASAPASPVSPLLASSAWAVHAAPALQRAYTTGDVAALRAMSDEDEALEMHAAQVAVKAALDVLDEPTLHGALRISTARDSYGLAAPVSPALSSPTSPAESCFSDCEGAGKKKGRARMSQEKRKRLARRREREALLAALAQHDPHGYAAVDALSRSAPVTPTSASYFAPTTGFGAYPFSSYSYDAAAAPFSPHSSPRGLSVDSLPSPALTHASVRTPASSAASDPHSSPPTLVVQPPSPQRLRTAYAKEHTDSGARWRAGWMGECPIASVY